MHVINFKETSTTVNPYVKLLYLKDTNALIVKANTGIPTGNFSGSYLVLFTNGEMYRYGVYYINEKTHIRKIKITEAEQSKFRKLIEEAAALNASQLNLKQVTTKDGSKATIDFTNYPDYYLEIYHDKKVSKYYSKSADGFIEARADGYPMRQKLVSLYNALDFSETIIAAPIEQVKAQDTVYIHFKKSEFEVKQQIAGGDYLYDIAVGEKQHLYLLQKKDALQSQQPKDFITRHKDAVIDFDFFLKYGTKTGFLNLRTVYIINDEANGKVSVSPVTLQFIEP